MLEKLFVQLLLWNCGLTAQKEYNSVLDEMFLNNSADCLLLDLEEQCDSVENSITLLNEYLYKNKMTIDIDAFGKALLTELKNIYYSNGIDLKSFCSGTYKLWLKLPEGFSEVEPFLTLCYADDPLNDGDEKHTREIFENLFHYY